MRANLSERIAIPRHCLSRFGAGFHDLAVLVAFLLIVTEVDRPSRLLPAVGDLAVTLGDGRSDPTGAEPCPVRLRRVPHVREWNALSPTSSRPRSKPCARPAVSGASRPKHSRLRLCHSVERSEPTLARRCPEASVAPVERISDSLSDLLGRLAACRTMSHRHLRRRCRRRQRAGCRRRHLQCLLRFPARASTATSSPAHRLRWPHSARA